MPDLSSDELAAEKRKQQIHHVQNHFAQLARLHSVSHRVMVANRHDCKDDVAPQLALTSVAPGDLPERYKVAAREALGLGENTLTVVAVVENGPAARAGIAAGDELIALDELPIPAKNSSAWMKTHLVAAGERPVRVDIKRAGTPHTRVVQPVMGCAVPVFLATDDTPNAFTDGQRIVVHTGILRVARSDAELSTVVGHELAHVTMGHIKKREQNKAAGAVGGLAVDIGFALLGVNTGGAFSRGLGNAVAQAYATDFEREADYVGTYYSARAGFDSTAAEGFWRSLAQENPKQIFYAGLHPTSPERFLLMQKTNEEIGKKKRSRLPLVPELKKQETPVASADLAAGQNDR